MSKYGHFLKKIFSNSNCKIEFFAFRKHFKSKLQDLYKLMRLWTFTQLFKT
jgi:hypothetical protein